MKVFMKRLSLFSVLSFASILLVGCTQESTKINSNNSNQNPYCIGQNYYNYGCPGYGTSNGGTTSGSTTGSTTGGTTGTTTGGTTGGSNYNPYPNYGSTYVDKNWSVHYPYVPSINCTDATTPSNINYTPYETRKGTITLAGKNSYDPSSGQSYFDTTSSSLQSVSAAQNFFWGDTTLKVRFKANLQPESANTTTVCPGRKTGQSSIKGYGRIKFDLTLVGTKGDGSTGTAYLGTKTIDINKCTSALNLSSYAEEYPNGIYLKISNVQGNQNWSPGIGYEAYYDNYGFIYPQNPYVENTWKAIRDAECWSLDIEVAADGTKTFN